MRDLEGTEVSDYVCTPTNSADDGVSVYPQVCKGNVLKQTTRDKNGDTNVKYVCEPLCRYALKVIDPRPAGTSSLKYGGKTADKKATITGAAPGNWFENMFATKIVPKPESTATISSSAAAVATPGSSATATATSSSATTPALPSNLAPSTTTATTDRCAITQCALYARGCKTAYAGGKVEVINPKYTNGKKEDPKAEITFTALTNVPDGYSETVCVACANAGEGSIVYKDGWVV